MVSSFNLHTDFANELVSKTRSNEYTTTTKNSNNLNIAHISIHKYPNELNKPIGEYYSFEFIDIQDQKKRNKISLAIAKELNKLLDKYHLKEMDRILVVGLGNTQITADSLGPKTSRRIIVTNHIVEYTDIKLPKGSKRVAVFNPGVMGQTGLESSDIIKAINKIYDAKLIIAIDALASLKISRINKMIQITDTGIHPGSGIGNKRKGITSKELGVPVIAIGVATVVEASSILNQVLEELKVNNKKVINKILSRSEFNLIVTPKDIDEEIELLGDLIATSINYSIHENFKEL